MPVNNQESNPSLGGHAQMPKLSIDALDDEHRIPFIRAVTRILSTEIAETTYAQIVDGLPLAGVVLDAYCESLDPAHPVYNHEDLCPGVLEQTRAFREAFDPGSLQFDTALLSAYHTASPGSRAFKTRLIELIAIAVHHIAVLLFNLNTSRHQDNGITTWAPPNDDKHAHWWDSNPHGPTPTLFYHFWYRDYAQYPNGIADMAGYWAEARILGGVVLFDRKTPESDAVYWHPDRDEVTYRICRLLDEQKRDLLDFLIGEDVGGPGETKPVLPLLPDKSNDQRVDPEEPIAETGVYRDIWERKLFPVEWGDGRLANYLPRGVDYTSKSEWRRSHKLARWRFATRGSESESD